MIKYERFQLDNGLRFVVHQDQTTPIVAFNLLYNVGARDENPERTGFAHLFEHLMFEGSVNIPSYDTPLQQAGGENNAFTNNDITNYYITLPKENIETAFWLESDRMLQLAFSEEKLEVQKKVVIEEYKQRYLNQPYGDWSLHLRPLAYKKHPYQWATIGKDPSHVENANLKEVEAFFYNYYAPNNAIISIVGNVKIDEMKRLAQKWFGTIPKRNVPQRNLPVEPIQQKENFLSLERKVPLNAIYKAFHMENRLSQNYYTCDLISDILSNGKSARLIQKLVKEKRIFNSINAYITGDIDPGLFLITGNLNEGVSFEKGEEALVEELDKIKKQPLEERELEKVKNKIEATLVYSEVGILNKAMNLAFYELLGDAEIINQEVEKYRKISREQIKSTADKLFDKNNCSTLYYKK